ncbi:PepSY-associated TM helix domain-containing protein [Crenobacter cavernae]|uniref:PepSY domain-containing protein n=1 Tax=Crenobacter cavernae TaxID=2290923 RepID=A0ABY0FI93_9NEIS|nr:PepSY-associated TM helix domain-containing protein [Crenobacter cavernae]RXZ45132.1 PepSY domain-containing protein [Crenobacter cavernae]
MKTLKPAALWLHRQLGLWLSLFMLILGLSGALLVFKPELQKLASTPAAPATTPGVPAYQALYDTVHARYPHAGFNLRFSADPAAPVRAYIRVDGEKRVLTLDAASGALLHDAEADAGFFPWLFALHDSLLLGENGKTAVGAIGIGLLLCALSGLVFWWPKRAKGALRLHPDTGSLPWHKSVHRAAGALAAAFLISASLSGALLVFSKPVQGGINRLAGTPEASKLKAAPGVPLPLAELVARADAALPGGRLVDVRVPAKAGEAWQVRKKLPGEIHPNGLSLVQLDAANGRVLKTEPIDKAPAGRWLLQWTYPLHTGVLGGTVLRVFVLLAGLAGVYLGATGLWMWWARRQRRRVREAVPA